MDGRAERLAAPGQQDRLTGATISDVLAAAAVQSAQRQALVFYPLDGPVLRMSYGELWHGVRRVARAIDRAVPPGATVALWSVNRPEWTVVQLACATAGRALVPLNPSFTPAEVAFHLRASGAAALLFDRSYRSQPRELPEVERMHLVATVVEWVARAQGDGITGRHSGVPFDGVGPATPALIQYTSGTTGVPKGAVLHHRGLLLGATVLNETLDLGPDPVWINSVPLCHVGGCGPFTLAPLVAGGSLVVLERFTPELLLRAVTAERASIFGGVPTMLLDLMERFDQTRHSMASVRAVMSGGTSVPPALVRRIEAFFGVRYVGSYGQTETHSNTTLTLPTDSAEDKATTVGLALAHMDVRIVDAAGECVNYGVVGELCARGPTVMAGYLGDPVATAAAIDPDGWLRSGDLCEMDGRGYVRFVGRCTDMIVRGGENVYPREVENVLADIASVAEVAVVGIASERLGEEVAAFVRPVSPVLGVDLEEIDEVARRQLAWYKRPRVLVAVTGFPRTASGKVEKYRLAENWDAGHELHNGPPGEWEVLAVRWSGGAPDAARDQPVAVTAPGTTPSV